MEREVHPILKIYDKRADKYDKMTYMLEKLFSKQAKIFRLLKGNILEIGVGTGNNLMNYNKSANVTALDWSPQMVRHAKLKVKRLGLDNIKDIIVGDIQQLNKYFKAETFDFVVSRCVFCSVPDPVKGLQQVAEVLHSSGKLVQIEHGLSNSRFINNIMKFFDPITAKLQGFHITRNILKNLEKSGFKVIYSWAIDPIEHIKVIISKPISDPKERTNGIKKI